MCLWKDGFFPGPKEISVANDNVERKIRRGDGYREENTKGVLRRVSPPVGNLPVSVALLARQKRF